MKLFYYRFPGGFYALGPIEAETEKEAIAKIKKFEELPRKNFEIWETTQESINAIGKMEVL